MPEPIRGSDGSLKRYRLISLIWDMGEAALFFSSFPGSFMIYYGEWHKTEAMI